MIGTKNDVASYRYEDDYGVVVGAQHWAVRFIPRAPQQAAVFRDWLARSGARHRSPRSGGADRDRTGDLLLAKQALSQLSYSPTICDC
jgi:hypothetical protein